MFYKKRRYVLQNTGVRFTKHGVRLVEITKTILRLICGISAITLHQYYSLADSERSFGEGWEEDWREKVSNGSPSTLLSCG